MCILLLYIYNKTYSLLHCELRHRNLWAQLQNKTRTNIHNELTLNLSLIKFKRLNINTVCVALKFSGTKQFNY